MLYNFIEITLLYGWYPVNLLRCCRTPLPYGGLLLDIYTITRNTFILSIFSFQFINIKQYLWKQKPVLVYFSFSYQGVKTIFYKCAHFLFFIPFHSSNSSIPFLYEDSKPDSHHSHPDSPHSHHSPHSVLRFPIPAFTDNWKMPDRV